MRLRNYLIWTEASSVPSVKISQIGSIVSMWELSEVFETNKKKKFETNDKTFRRWIGERNYGNRCHFSFTRSRSSAQDWRQHQICRQLAHVSSVATPKMKVEERKLIGTSNSKAISGKHAMRGRHLVGFRPWVSLMKINSINCYFVSTTLRLHTATHTRFASAMRLIERENWLRFECIFSWRIS